MIAVAAAAGLVIGFLLVPRAPTTSDERAKPPEVRLLGQPLELGDGAIARALDRVRRYVARPLTLELPGKKTREVYPGRLGVEIDKVRLAQLVRDARDPTSPLRRVWRASAKKGPIVLPVPLVVNAAHALPMMLALKDDLDRVPVDARLDLEKRKLVPEVLGRWLDVDASIAALEDGLEEGARSVALAFEMRKPKRVASELKNVKFNDVLGYFETHYDRSERSAARTFNLRLAASKLDGHVLMPGEIFDFNDVVGPRDEAAGYKVAPVIAQGQLVDGLGGGTCQISGTLHAAAFFAGLDIVERFPHTRPSEYIQMGLDATVVYPTIDFRIKNSFKFPIVLHETVKNGVVRAEILGPKRTRTVTMIRHIDSVIPYTEEERPDKNLPEGVRVLSQRGVPGFKLHLYRIIRDGPNAIRQRFDDEYPPTTQIIRVGTGDMPKDSVKIHQDRAPEYTTSELLVMTQGVDTGSSSTQPGGATLTWRTRGKYGDRDWIEKAGMPVWHSGHDESVESETDSAHHRPKRHHRRAERTKSEHEKRK